MTPTKLRIGRHIFTTNSKDDSYEITHWTTHFLMTPTKLRIGRHIFTTNSKDDSYEITHWTTHFYHKLKRWLLRNYALDENRTHSLAGNQLWQLTNKYSVGTHVYLIYTIFWQSMNMSKVSFRTDTQIGNYISHCISLHITFNTEKFRSQELAKSY